MASNSSDLKKFAQAARRDLIDQVKARLNQVLAPDSPQSREAPAAVQELHHQIAETSREAVIERAAYTWFNRFSALRYMDLHRINRIGVVTPQQGYTQPEILQEAKQGHIDEDLHRFINRQLVFDLLSGKRPSREPEQEAYRLLLVAACNALSDSMPFMFEKIADWTELLMPADLLSENSVLHALRNAMTPEACKDVEIIGWLYQYYISERKDEVFEGLKKNQKIAPEDIPAATQLFTPHWIVRYLVENSLGRLWLLNYPDSRLAERMEYYIQPVEPETDFIKLSSPEEIKICDPACGSGHMLTYAFDLLCAIYEEQGYNPLEIPRLILEKNLFGIEIDERAGALAAFALAMKAREQDKRFFSRGVVPNICIMENVRFSEQELNEYLSLAGSDLFSAPLLETLRQFEQAKTFGSLIRPILSDAAFVRQELERKNLGGNVLLYLTHERLLKVLRMAEYLSARYQVVVTNPPYMGGAGMNDDLKLFVKSRFENGYPDLYGCFIERSFTLAIKSGVLAMITIPNWMYLKSFEKLRVFIQNHATILFLVDNGRGVWGSDFGSSAFVLSNNNDIHYLAVYKRLFSSQGKVSSNETLQKRFHNHRDYPLYKASLSEFNKIPGSPIAYWVSKEFLQLISNAPKLGDLCPVKEGLNTGDNDRFLRYWHEVGYTNIGFGSDNRIEAKASNKKWFPCNKGGISRRWYGNNEYVINWSNDGYEIRNLIDETGYLISRPQNLDYYFLEGITWSGVSISIFSGRYFPKGHIFNSAGRSLIPKNEDIWHFLGLLNSKVGIHYFKIVAPTPSFTVGNVASLPIINLEADVKKDITEKARSAVDITKDDWDHSEISWDYSRNPLLGAQNYPLLRDAYFSLQQSWQKKVNEMLFIESEINKTFINIYNLDGEINPNVPIEDITLTCNPQYRYEGKRSLAELDARLVADTMKEFISYAVGCMFGRYSLDKPGLILANQSETLADYLRQVPNPSFLPDKDNVLPVLDGDWFPDDITERFKQFLRVSFSEEHYSENLAFIEEAIGRDIRSYFLKDFYGEHLKMYKKRPIYWLFSSPKGSFNALIYMHRYTKDTCSVVLNYLKEYRAKLEAHQHTQEQVTIRAGSSQREKTAALKEIERLNKVLEELRAYEQDVLYPLAANPIEIDLDDGVKVNYAKFGSALAKIAGL